MPRHSKLWCQSLYAVRAEDPVFPAGDAQTPQGYLPIAQSVMDGMVSRNHCQLTDEHSLFPCGHLWRSLLTTRTLKSLTDILPQGLAKVRICLLLLYSKRLKFPLEMPFPGQPLLGAGGQTRSPWSAPIGCRWGASDNNGLLTMVNRAN